MNHQQSIPLNSFSLEGALNPQPLIVSHLQKVTEVVVLMEQTGQDCALVQENQQLVGIVTEKELVKLAIRGTPLTELSLASVMTKNPLAITVSQLQDWGSVASIWQQHQITHLPIVDGENRPVGLITASTFLPSLLDTVSNTVREQQPPATQQLTCVRLAEFQAMFNALSEAVIFADTNRRIQILNPAALNLFGYQIEELIGKQTVILYSSEAEYQRQGRRRFNLSAVEQREPYEVNYRRRNGTEFVGETVGTVVKDDTGEIIGFLGIIRDVTHQKQTERQLKNTEYLMQKISEATPNLFYIYDLHQQRNIYANRELASDLGYTPEAIGEMGREIYTHLFHPDELEQILAHHQKIATNKEQELFEIEYRVRRANGEWLWFYSWEVVFSRNEAGFPTQILGTAVNITKRKQLEQELECFFSLSVDLFCLAGTDGYFKRVNPAFEKVIGYSQEELLSQPFINFVHPDDRETSLAEMGKLTKGTPTVSFENRYRCSDGSYKWLAWNAFPLPEEGVLYAVARDITERKEVEQRLRLQERAIAASQNAIVIADARQPDYPIIFVNPAFERITGYRAAEVIGRNCRFLQGQDRSQPELVELRECLKTGKNCTVVLGNYRKDGSLFWNKLSISPISDEGGRLTHYLGIQTDVTERIESERTLKQQLAAVEAAIDGIAILDTEERYIYLNKSHLQLFGYEDATDLLGQTWRNLYSPDEVERFEQNIFPLLLRDGYWQGEATGQRRDGSTFAEEVSLTLTEYGLVCVCRDISERKQVELALRESQEKLQAIMDNTSNVIYLKDVQGRYLLINRQYEKLFHLTREQIIGKTDSEIFSAEIAAAVMSNDLQILAAKMSLEFEETVPQDDGLHTYISIKFPLWDAKGKVYGVCGISTDITERKRTEAALKQAQSALRRTNEELEKRVEQRTAELTRSNQELEQFAYIVSHDLQEPLRKMKSFSQLLARECQGQFTENEKAQRYLDYIIDAAERQRQMIQALLNYSRLGRNDSSLVAINLDSVVGKVLEDLSIPMAKTGATVTVSDLPTVQASPTQMAQLFLNLIGNGIKFKGDTTPRIQIKAQLQRSEWLISVQDNGIGINPKYAERIFQIFQRLHSRNEYPGTGIGLAICRKIVEGHGGSIWVVSEPGQGSTFYFTLPVSSSPS
ncbi:MAG: PAS domain S-box protein [Xenococcaceae cyanobacterium MO_234.B1]|nr:PAS domain S-box protein [Xenococcaceae cyanobacterium MO_234.B1]